MGLHVYSRLSIHLMNATRNRMILSPATSRPWRTLLRTEVLAICFVVFCADVVSGMVTATFSRFATNLGASVALVGALTGFMALVSIFVALPMGLLSDRLGRRWVVAGGMLGLALSTLLYTLAPSPYWLFPVRMLAALAMLAAAGWPWSLTCLHAAIPRRPHHRQPMPRAPRPGRRSRSHNFRPISHLTPDPP